MKAELTKGLSGVAKQEREDILRGCSPGFEVLKGILRERIADGQHKLINPDYNTTHLGLMHADLIGRIRAYQDLLDLITL